MTPRTGRRDPVLDTLYRRRRSALVHARIFRRRAERLAAANPTDASEHYDHRLYTQ